MKIHPVINIHACMHARMTGGKTSVDAEAGHCWNEVYIDGTVYVINFNNVYPREGFYEKRGWIVTDSDFGSSDYDPDWYKK